MSITTYVKGGCANQMFQYAAGLAVARYHNTTLQIDNSRFDQDSEWRVYSLGLFAGVHDRIVKGRPDQTRVVQERSLRYDPQVFATSSGDCWLDGYWQTEKYFAHLKAELKSRFMPARTLEPLHEAMRERILELGDRSVFLTIRRTDYVGNAFHGLLPFEYYRQAADIIASKVNDPVFFVFTDEPEWPTPQTFPLPYQWIVAGNWYRTVKPRLGREDAELYLMRQCRHAILANSSYSWWGAWLGRADEDGLVIAPKNWFGPASHEDARDIVPERWMRI
jgi:Glycosyl transferase family 11